MFSDLVLSCFFFFFFSFLFGGCGIPPRSAGADPDGGQMCSRSCLLRRDNPAAEWVAFGKLGVPNGYPKLSRPTKHAELVRVSGCH
jgi:hypothetical protein